MRTDVEEIAFAAVAVPFACGENGNDHVVSHLYRTGGQPTGRFADPRRALMRWTTKAEWSESRPNKDSLASRLINRLRFKRKAKR